MIANPSLLLPRQTRATRAAHELRDRLEGKPPTDQLFQDFAQTWAISTDELKRAWVRVGFE